METMYYGDYPELRAISNRASSGKQVGSQLRWGLSSFLVRSRRGSVVRGTLHLFLFFCVCWVFQVRIT
jgi:hypothetical protein